MASARRPSGWNQLIAWFTVMALVASIAGVRPRAARADGPPGAAAATPGATKKARADIALWRVEPLGLEPERVARLEALFRAELERLAGAPLPSRAEVERAAAADPVLRGCAGEPECLAAIGKKLGVKQMVSGNVGALGDSYVINLKLVDVDGAKEVRRVSEPLSGSPDELIDAVRVAAYRLIAPERLRGSITILSDVPGAEVMLDGKRVGKTPLAQPLAGLDVGSHKLMLRSSGYTDFLSDVEVRFQKTTQVVVTMVAAPESSAPPPLLGGPVRPPRTPWWSSTWAYVGYGAGAITLGVLVGYWMAPNGTISCSKDPAACGR